MIFRQLFDRESCTYTYLIADETTRAAALVDPVREHVARDLEVIADLGLHLTHIFETHVHADHITGAGELRKRTGAKSYVARDGGAPCADVPLGDGDVTMIGAVELRALTTPGHTSDCLSFVVGERGTFDRVLTGDALFVRGCGRTDFQNGDASTLYDSVHEKLFSLPEATFVYPGHDYRGLTVSTIGEEKRLNPRLGGGTTKEAFVAKMAALDLPPPAKIAEAVPANRACGNVE
jgi:glyoxylase-like metal-dependent hydrolase (beta-lactamase superfamily II)